MERLEVSCAARLQRVNLQTFNVVLLELNENKFMKRRAVKHGVFHLQGESRTPSVTQRGPLVSLEMLRSVKLRSSQSRHRSSEQNKGTAKFVFNSSR
jgi:hypothetical protein